MLSGQRVGEPDDGAVRGCGIDRDFAAKQARAIGHAAHAQAIGRSLAAGEAGTVVLYVDSQLFPFPAHGFEPEKNFRGPAVANRVAERFLHDSIYKGNLIGRMRRQAAAGKSGRHFDRKALFKLAGESCERGADALAVDNIQRTESSAYSPGAIHRLDDAFVDIMQAGGFIGDGVREASGGDLQEAAYAGEYLADVVVQILADARAFARAGAKAVELILFFLVNIKNKSAHDAPARRLDYIFGAMPQPERVAAFSRYSIINMTGAARGERLEKTRHPLAIEGMDRLVPPYAIMDREHPAERAVCRENAADVERMHFAFPCDRARRREQAGRRPSGNFHRVLCGTFLHRDWRMCGLRFAGRVRSARFATRMFVVVSMNIV